MLPIPETTTEVEATDPGVEAFRAAAEQSLMDAAAPETETPKVKPTEASGGGDPEGATAEKAKPAQPEAETVAPEELKLVPEQHRKFFESAPKEVRDWVKTQVEGSMKDADYRKKTAKVAEDRREAERFAADNRVKLDFAETVIGDDEAMQAIRDLQARRAGKAPASTPKSTFSWGTASDEEIEARLAQEREAAVKAALGSVRQEREQETQAQVEFREMATAAKSEFVDSGEYSAEEVDAVYDRLKARGVQFSKDNVVETLRDFLPKREAKKVESATPVAAKEATRSTASVLSRAAGTQSPVTAPAFVREKRAPRDPDEELEEAKWIVSQRRARAASRTS